jgi:hypothetical protein
MSSSTEQPSSCSNSIKETTYGEPLGNITKTERLSSRRFKVCHFSPAAFFGVGWGRLRSSS